MKPDLVFANTLNVFASNSWCLFAVLKSRIHEIWERFFGSSLTDRLAYTIPDCFENFPLPPRYGLENKIENAGRIYYEARKILMQAMNQGLTAVYNRLNDPEENDSSVQHIRELHDVMDRAVLSAHGWNDIGLTTIYEREWDADEVERPAPWRLRWPEDDRNEILARLLELNRRRTEEENHPASKTLAGRGSRRGARTAQNAPYLLI
jgi:hypothetical protein